jgi:hypothetical protein
VFGFPPILDNAGNIIGFQKDKIQLRVSGININADVSAGIKILHLLPLKLKNLNVTDLTLEASIQLHRSRNSWSLSDDTKITLGDFQIGMEERYLNYVLNLFKTH